MDEIFPKKLVCFTTLVSLSVLVLSSLAQNEDHFIYNGFHNQSSLNIHLAGLAQILPNGLLRLTNTSKPELGQAFHKLPFTFNATSAPNSLSFSTSFVFAMVPELPNLGGHGIAFALSPTLNFSNAFASQFLGLFNSSTDGKSSNHVFAIELDASLSPDYEDEDSNHVGVDVNGLKSVDAAPATYFSSGKRKNVSLDLISGKPMRVWIDYDGANSRVNVTLAPAKTAKPDRPLLSTIVDLSEVVLERMYVGFSASTGSIASDHYILGWSFSRGGEAPSLEISKLPRLPPRRGGGRKEWKVIVVLATISGVSLVVIMVGVAYALRRKRYREVREDWERIYGPQRLSYKSLYKATKGFRERELIGQGGFGKVYRGTLASTKAQIAVKKVSHNSEEGMEQFVAEIAAMGRLRHRNLVQLIGYCRRKGELLLAYEFMPNGSLDSYLFGREKPGLGWAQRLRILRDVASALLYLHEEWQQVVLHRDVKASNVLLDADWNGRLGDFGLARLCDHGADPHTTHVVGTVGYLAPELSKTGKATTSTDVFSFGVFMLEVACGRRPVKMGVPQEEVSLVDWVFECSKRGSIMEACDPKLEGDFVVEEMVLVLRLGLLCSWNVPAGRPSMRQVVQFLDGKATSALPEIQTRDCVSLTAFFSTHEAETPDLVMSFPSSLAHMGSQHGSFSSTDSIIENGR